MGFALHARVDDDLPYDLAQMIEVYVAEAMRATGTSKGIVRRPGEVAPPEPTEPASEPSVTASAASAEPAELDINLGVGSQLDYATLFDDEPLPQPLPRGRAPRGTTSPTVATVATVAPSEPAAAAPSDAEATPFDDEVTEPMVVAIPNDDR
jgi:hypothetical protein